MDNKNTFASNLNHYMKLKKVSRRQLSEALGLSYFTITDWVKGKKYPRMDKVEMLADFFGVKKSDLIEDKDMPDINAEFSSDLGFTSDRASKWLEITKGQPISDDEFDKVLEYLRFVISQRGK